MTDKSNLYLIGKIPGYTEHISHLVSMLHYVRHGTISAIQKLSVSELDYRKDKDSNSIGSLLLHIAAAEVGYQAATFFNRQLTPEEKNEWDTALGLGYKSQQEIKGHDVHYYLEKLDQVRAITLAELAKRDDKWLLEQTSFGDNNKINNYFKWFHVLTHEVNHRGQIRTLIRQANRDLETK
ncbi:MAG TPA: DinB family protein [Chitinophagaceae bacterium]|nr:DinB family protein [Chitinophagaceae bacterium]